MMSEARYNVVVVGTAMDGFEINRVKIDFTKLFGLTEAKTEQIFTRGRVAIKKNVDEVTAKKFLNALQGIGANAEILESTGSTIKAEPTVKSNHPSDSSVPSKPAQAGNKPANKAFEITPNSAAAQAPQTSHASATPMGKADFSQSSNLAHAGVDLSKSGAESNPGQTGSESISDQETVLSFRFLGTGSEYARVWIVNILLTIVTLGIYSAWAKVRNAQYFYGHTEIAGSRFAYLAKPITILIGRLIAVAIFVVFSVVAELFPIIGGVLSLGLIILIPWIVVRSLRFNARMSAWRNIRFGFDGTMKDAAIAFILWPIIGLITLGILMPLALYKQTEYIIKHSRYGTARFQLNPCPKPYYIIYFKAFLILILAGIIAGILSVPLPFLAPLVMVVVYFYLFAFISVQTANLIYSNTSLSQNKFELRSFWEEMSYLKLIFINSLLILLTLGLYIPWAKVRVAQYKADHLEMLAYTEPDGFVAAQEEKISALGQEFGDVFDMEVGL